MSRKVNANVYPCYRPTPIGEALMDIIGEVKELNMMRPELEEILMRSFDHAITKVLANLEESDSSGVTVSGSTSSQKFIKNFYEMAFTPAVIEFPEATHTSSSLGVTAVEGKKVQQEEKKKRKKN